MINPTRIELISIINELLLFFVQCELESLKRVNDFLEIEINNADENGDEVKTESTREEAVMEDIEVKSEWEADETVQEKHDPLV